MNSNEKSRFKLTEDFVYCIDASKNDKKSLCDADLCILGEYDTQQTYAIKLAHQNFTELSLVKIAMLSWGRLTTLNLEGNRIRTIGCKYLTKIVMPIMNDIRLAQNEVSPDGVLHLIKGNWPQLVHLKIQLNGLHRKSISMLTKGNWLKLQNLTLRQKKEQQISLWLYYEVITISTERLASISIGNQKIVVSRFFRNLLKPIRLESQKKILTQIKNRFVKLPPFFDF